MSSATNQKNSSSIVRVLMSMLQFIGILAVEFTALRFQNAATPEVDIPQRSDPAPAPEP